MRYEDIIAELEHGNSLDEWTEVPSSRILEDRLTAMRQLQASYEHKARVLDAEQRELSRLLTPS
jgi:hypothetical protein